MFMARTFRYFSIPVQVAVNYNIPLIVWGENSQNEYGGPAVAKDSKILIDNGYKKNLEDSLT